MYVTNKFNADPLERPFTQMGARVKFEELDPDRRVGVELNVRNTEGRAAAMGNVAFLD